MFAAWPLPCACNNQYSTGGALVTQSQWTSEVAGEMGSIAGKQYYLEYHDPSKESSVEYEYTEIIPKGRGV